MKSFTSRVLAAQAGPNTLKERRWGGHRLAKLRGGSELVGVTIGESWEFSTLPGSESYADGRALTDVLGRPLGFLAKLIDTSTALSIQVHPDDDPEQGVVGKEEAWVVLDADENAHVLAGVRSGIDEAELEQRTRAAVADPSRGDALADALDRIAVRAGTVILVPARTVHAIGGGILLAEIQQPADCTYRLFDYGSGREIHPDQALASLSVDARPTVWKPGDAPTTLSGKRLDLQIVDRELDVDASRVDHLVVPVSGTTQVQGNETEDLAPGQLRLCAGGEFRLSTDGLAVVGSLPRPA